MNDVEYIKYYELICDNVHISTVIILLNLTYQNLYILMTFLSSSPLMVRYSCDSVSFGNGDCGVGLARPVNGVGSGIFGVILASNFMSYVPLRHPTPFFSLYTIALNIILSTYKTVNYHFYADDTQLYIYIYILLTPTNLAIATLQTCLTDVQSWMATNELKLNLDKTEFMLLDNKSQRENLTVFFLLLY